MSLYRLYADPLDFLFFDRPFQLRSRLSGGPLFLHPKSNLRENAQSYEIEIELPGVDAKDIKVEVSKGHLSITAERREMSEGKEEEGEEAKKESRLSYKRLFRLPEAIDAKGIASTLKNGLLKIVLPKKEEEKPVIVPVAAKL